MAVKSSGAKTPVSVDELIYPKDFDKIVARVNLKTNIMIYGDERFSIDDLTSDILGRIKKMTAGKFNNAILKHVAFNDPNFDFSEFLSSEDTFGLFADEDFNVKVLRGLDEYAAAAPLTKKFVKYLDALTSKGVNEGGTGVVVVVYADKKPPADVLRNARHFLFINCKKLYENDVLAYARKLCARSQKSFTDDAIALLCEKSRMNLFQINSEIKRLAIINYETAEIDAEIIDSGVEVFFDPESFGAINELDYCIYKKDLKKALLGISDLVSHGIYHAIIVNRLIAIYRSMLGVIFLNEASETFERGAFKIAKEYVEGIKNKKGYERFRFSNEITAKYEYFCTALASSAGMFRSASKYDYFNSIKTPMALYCVYYLKNYSEKELFSLMKSLYQIDVKVRSGVLRPDQRPETVLEEIFKILISHFDRSFNAN